MHRRGRWVRSCSIAEPSQRGQIPAASEADWCLQKAKRSRNKVSPPSLWTHSFSDAIIATTRRKDLKINVHRRMKGRKKYQSGIIITVYKTFHSFIIINCKVLLMHILSQHSCHMWSEDSEPVPGDNGTDIDNQEFLLCSSQHSHSSDWN